MNGLQKRLEELSAQNSFFRDAMASGEHPAGREVEEALLRMIDREKDQKRQFEHLLPSRESDAERHGDEGSVHGRRQSHFSTESGGSGETGGGGGGGGGSNHHKSAGRRVSTEAVGGSFVSRGHGTLAMSGSFKLQSKRLAEGSTLSVPSPVSVISSTSLVPGIAPRPRIRERSVNPPDLVSDNRGKDNDVFKASAAAARLAHGLTLRRESHAMQHDDVDRRGSVVHDGLDATHGSMPMSSNTISKTVAMSLAPNTLKTFVRGSDSLGGAGSINIGGVFAGGAAYSGGLQQEVADEQKGGIARSDWLSSFHAMLATVKAAKGGGSWGGGLMPLAARHDNAKHGMMMIQEQAHNLLEGVAENSRGFREAVDSPDPRHRVTMLRDVSDMLKMLGLLSDILHTANALSRTPLDLETTCNSLISHFKRLVDAANVRLFLVDQAKQTVSEWDGVNGKSGPPKSYHAAVHMDTDDEYEQVKKRLGEPTMHKGSKSRTDVVLCISDSLISSPKGLDCHTFLTVSFHLQKVLTVIHF